MDTLVTARLPTEFGSFQITALHGDVPQQPHLILQSEVEASDVPLVRIHSECWTGDVVGSLKCDCGPQLQSALSQISREGGAVIYLRQEGRGIGLVEKLKAYNLQDDGLDTFEANERLGHQRDERSYDVAAEALMQLEWRQIRLLTNNPDKAEALRRFGIDVLEVIPLEVEPNPHNLAYLQSKKAEAKR